MNENDLDSIFKSYYDSTVRHIRRYVNNIYDAEDIAMNVFLKIQSSLRNKEIDQSKIKNYCEVSATNEVYRFLKKQYKNAERNLQNSDATELILSSIEDHTFQSAERQYETERMARMLFNNVPEKYKEILWAYCNGITSDELATYYGLNSTQAAHSRMNTAIRAVRKAITPKKSRGKK